MVHVGGRREPADPEHVVGDVLVVVDVGEDGFARGFDDHCVVDLGHGGTPYSKISGGRDFSGVRVRSHGPQTPNRPGIAAPVDSGVG